MCIGQASVGLLERRPRRLQSFQKLLLIHDSESVSFWSLIAYENHELAWFPIRHPAAPSRSCRHRGGRLRRVGSPLPARLLKSRRRHGWEHSLLGQERAVRRGSRDDRRCDCGGDHPASLGQRWHTASHRDQLVSRSGSFIPFHCTHDLGVQSAILHPHQKLHPGEDLRHRGGPREPVRDAMITTSPRF